MNCWYCQVNQENWVDAVEKMMYCVTSRHTETKYLGTHTTRAAQYSRETVRIPRCHACKVDERMTVIWAIAGGVVGLFIGASLANLLENRPLADPGSGDLLYFVSAVVVAVIAGYVAVQIRNARAAGTRPKRIHSTKDFPRLKELKAAGWTSDAPSA
jgi:uncharacterized membrane protein YeaQ/YmgE (transglycosylase-associated protein family)